MTRLIAILLCAVALSAQAGITGYPCYRTMPEMEAAMDSLVATYPHLARITNVGTTIEGRTIRGVVLSSIAAPGPKYAVMLNGGIHANEMGPSEFLTMFAERLCAGYATNGDYRYALDWSEIHIIPVVSVDSRLRVDTQGPLYDYRNNMHDLGCSLTNGVNLNRNFPWDWNYGTNGIQYSTEPCNNLFSGETAASEPETQAYTNHVWKLFGDHRGPGESTTVSNTVSGLLLDLHTQAATLLFYRTWSNAVAPNVNEFTSLARKGRHYTGYSLQGAGTSLGMSAGTVKNWAFGELGVPTMTWEFGLIGKFDCANYANHVLTANLPAFEYMIRAGRQPFKEAAAPEIVGLTVTVGTSNVLTISGSATDVRNAEDPSQDITGVRCSIGLPPWHEGATTGTIPHTKTATGVATFSGTVDASALPGGEYVLYADASDGTHGSGVTSAAIFTIIGDEDPPPPTATTIRGDSTALRGVAEAWRGIAQ